MNKIAPPNIASFTITKSSVLKFLIVALLILVGSYIAWVPNSLSIAIIVFSLIACLSYGCVTLVNVRNGFYVFLFLVPIHLLAIVPLKAMLSEFDFAIFSALKDIFLLILTSCFVLEILGNRIRLPKNRITILILLFVFCNILISVLTMGKIALWGLRQQLGFVVFYFLTIGLVKNKREIEKSIVAFAGGSLIVAGYAFYVLISSRIGYGYEFGYLPEHIVGRLTVFGGPETSGFFSTYISTMALVLFAFLFFYRNFKSFANYIILAMMALLYTLETIFSFSRRAWVATLIVVVLMSLLGKKIKYIAFLVIMLVVIFGLSYYFSPKATRILYDRLQSISDTDNVYNTPRLLEWKHLLNRSRGNLFLGEGLGAVGSVSNKFDIKNAANTHNIYLSKLVQTGIIGLSIFMIISFTALRLMIKSFFQSHTPFFKSVSAAMIMVFTSLMIQSFFSLGIEVYPFSLYYWFFIGLSVSVFAIVKEQKELC